MRAKVKNNRRRTDERQKAGRKDRFTTTVLLLSCLSVCTHVCPSLQGNQHAQGVNAARAPNLRPIHVGLSDLRSTKQAHTALGRRLDECDG